LYTPQFAKNSCTMCVTNLLMLATPHGFGLQTAIWLKIAI